MRYFENRKNVNGFAKKISKTVNDKKHTSYEVLFYLTEHCNLACPGCYMNSNPARTQVALPSEDILHWMRQFSKVPNFSDSVVFTGGEIFTMDVPYLEYNIQNALDTVTTVHLKTNGVWVNNPEKSKQIWDMLRRLKVQRGLTVTQEQFHQFLSQFDRNYARAHKDEILARAWRELPTAAALDLCVSVDNKIHPKQSAQWFREVVQHVSGDEKLKNSVNVKSFTFEECRDSFVENVFQALGCEKRDSKFHPDANVLQYKACGIPVESYFGVYQDTSAPLSPEDNADIGLCGSDRNTTRLAFYFYPDRTVSFSNPNFQPVGRVSYVDARGRYKSLRQLRLEMVDAMVAEYRRYL